MPINIKKALSAGQNFHNTSLLYLHFYSSRRLFHIVYLFSNPCICLPQKLYWKKKFIEKKASNFLMSHQQFYQTICICMHIHCLIPYCKLNTLHAPKPVPLDPALSQHLKDLISRVITFSLSRCLSLFLSFYPLISLYWIIPISIQMYSSQRSI